MNFKRMRTILKARNHEFFRDRAAFGWNFLFPFLIVAGFGIIFGGQQQTEFKVGVFPAPTSEISRHTLELPWEFAQSPYAGFIGFENFEQGLDRLKHHKIDILVKAGPPPFQYWISDSSPKGYIAEKVFNASLMPDSDRHLALKRDIKGREIRYVDWLFPGILAMNMMFSALYGVGYIVVRYRKNGVLKRLKATPLTALEYLSAQALSRIFLLMFTLVVVWIGCDLVFSFRVEGSYTAVFVVFFMGGLSLIALGLILAARGTSEEFTNGVLNFITWPMMFLSEVWFSIEGAPRWVKLFSQIFPLTHMLTAVRRIMNDGASLMEVGFELSVLLGMTICFLVIGASMFSWSR
jgi:ABC-type multidrug transport system permease subunit